MTEPQHRALAKLSNEWQSAYELQESRATLEALVRQGLAECRLGAGHMFSPRTGIEYRIAPENRKGQDRV